MYPIHRYNAFERTRSGHAAGSHVWPFTMRSEPAAQSFLEYTAHAEPRESCRNYIVRNACRYTSSLFIMLLDLLYDKLMIRVALIAIVVRKPRKSVSAAKFRQQDWLLLYLGLSAPNKLISGMPTSYDVETAITKRHCSLTFHDLHALPHGDDASRSRFLPTTLGLTSKLLRISRHESAGVHSDYASAARGRRRPHDSLTRL